MNFEAFHENLDNKYFDKNIDPDSVLCSNIVKATFYTNDNLVQKFDENDKFAIFHMNARSLKSNFTEIKSYVEQFKFHVLAVSETWFNDHDCLDDYKIDGYTLYVSNIKYKRGGGVAIYASTNFTHSVVQSMSGMFEDCMQYLGQHFFLIGLRTRLFFWGQEEGKNKIKSTIF